MRWRVDGKVGVVRGEVEHVEAVAPRRHGPAHGEEVAHGTASLRGRRLRRGGARPNDDALRPRLVREVFGIARGGRIEKEHVLVAGVYLEQRAHQLAGVAAEAAAIEPAAGIDSDAHRRRRHDQRHLSRLEPAPATYPASSPAAHAIDSAAIQGAERSAWRT